MRLFAESRYRGIELATIKLWKKTTKYGELFCISRDAAASGYAMLCYRPGGSSRGHAMKTCLILGGIVLAAFGGLAGAQPPAGVFESAAPLTSQNPIDQLVFARLKELDIQPAHLCSDAVFVRRVYLDVIGTLPTGAEAEQFLLRP